MSKPFSFLRLPLELREQIYTYYFNPADRLEACEYFGNAGQYKFEFSLYCVNKQIYHEAQTVFRRENVFVRIETPWPQAVNHISHEGLCPIVVAHDTADSFRFHHALVQISAPAHMIAPAHSVIVLLDDLHLFCQVWYYSALNYETLNHHLRVTFSLQDPYYPADPKPIPIALQKRLLLPFGVVKELHEVEVSGYNEEVKAELDALMKVPYDSPQKCCEDATTLMEVGDKILAEGKPEEALEAYTKAFHAIHIIVQGRNRRVLAEQFFHKGIEEGRYQGQTGATVRIILRIMLVARVVNAYLKLQQYEDATYWGMRSIKIMRSTVGSEFEDFLIEVAGMLDVGLLYLRTGVSLMRMEENASPEIIEYNDDDDVGTSEKCFKFAKRFLKGEHRKLIKKELESNKVEVHEEFWLDNDGKGDNRSDVDSMAPMHQDEAEGNAQAEIIFHVWQASQY